MNAIIEEDVIFKGAGAMLAGTIAAPDSMAPIAAVALLTGSGASTRDYTIGSFALFRQLARELARRGIATLRWDDRGTGASGGSMSQSRIQDFADDACAARALLAARFQDAPVGLLGHSEGGAVALLAAAADTGTRFVVLLAAPAAPVRMNVLSQTENIHRTNGMDEEQIAREVALLARVFDVLASGAPFESLRPDFRQKARADIAAMSDEMRRALSDADQYGDVLFRQMEAMMDTPWFRSLLAFDAATVLPGVSCPIFAAFGERDLQVAHRMNSSRLAELLSSRAADSVRICTYPRANHLFQAAVSGSPVEYRTLQSEYVPGLMDDITAWIGERIVRQQ